MDDLCRTVRGALFENELSAQPDQQLGYCAPPEWFARHGATLAGADVEAAIKLYAIGRRHLRGRIQRSTALFINALGLVEPGSADYADVVAGLEAVKVANPRKVFVLAKEVRSIEDDSVSWREGVGRFEAWLKGVPLVGAIDQVADEEGDDEEDSDFKTGAADLERVTILEDAP